MLALEDTPGHLKSPSQLAVHRLINWHEIYSRRVVVSIIFSKIRVWVLILLTHYTTRGLSWADSMLNTTTRLTAAAGFQVLLLEFPLNITCGEGQEMIQSQVFFLFPNISSRGGCHMDFSFTVKARKYLHVLSSNTLSSWWQPWMITRDITLAACIGPRFFHFIFASMITKALNK